MIEVNDLTIVNFIVKRQQEAYSMIISSINYGRYEYDLVLSSNGGCGGCKESSKFGI